MELDCHCIPFTTSFVLFSYFSLSFDFTSSSQETLALGKDLIDETVQSFKDVKVNIPYCFIGKRCNKVLEDTNAGVRFFL